MLTETVLGRDEVETSINETAAFEKDRCWIDEQYEVLVRDYAEHWVAVKDGRVIASAVDLGELLSHVPDLAHTCVEFISPRRPGFPLSRE
jgi:hypothetical protein